MHPILHDSEHIRDTYHQSVIVLLKPLAITLLALMVPWYFSYQYGAVTTFRTLLMFWSLIVTVYALRELLTWRLNRYIVTNKRLIRFSHDGLFKRTVIETPHERILNVSYRTTGLLSVLFRFGDVEVQVVGLVEPIILRHIPYPAQIKDYLWQLHSRAVTNQGTFQADDLAHVQERMG
ncbi:MAG: PH domain-containing protein, partial [bacterium]|nr:PH domain-containing protein [bacterium]